MGKKSIYTPEYRKNWIFDEMIKNTDITYTTFLPVYLERFKLKSPTLFDRDWVAAKKRFAAYQTKLNKKKEDTLIKNEVKELEKGILDRIDNMKLLSEIALGNTEASNADRIKAIDTLNRMRGYYEADNSQSRPQQLVWNEVKDYSIKTIEDETER